MNTNSVMKYFYEISKIPRNSGQEEKVADYIEKFAQKRNLKYIRDKYNNVIVIKEASKNKQNSNSIILQAHLDMVCEKEENSNHNFEIDGLKIYQEGDFIKAKETTLGADNGIGVAIMLAILDSKEIEHPVIEAIFTVQEETTMLGAKEIDTSLLKSNKMICLDNMSEEELWIGCAGAKVFNYNITGDICENNKEYLLARIGLNGFMGGHSGKDISKKRGNPIKEMGNLLKELSSKYDITLKNIYGGMKVNVIPRECYSEIYVKAEDFDKINKEVIKFDRELKERIQENNEKIEASVVQINNKSNISFDDKTTKRIIDIIQAIPNGVYYVDKYENPLVSLNIGKVETNKKDIKLYFSIRYNRIAEEIKLEKSLDIIANKYNIELNCLDELAGYEHQQRSKFIDECKQIYQDYFLRRPKVIDMHVCLEAGFFGQKIQNLDFIAISPNIYDAHSPKERCSISSLEKVYNYIILILGNM